MEKELCSGQHSVYLHILVLVGTFFHSNVRLECGPHPYTQIDRAREGSIEGAALKAGQSGERF